MNLKEKAIKGVFWSVAEGWGRQLVSSVTFFVLARLLGPESYGLVALAGVYLSFVTLLSDQGLTQAIIQRKDLEPEHLDAAFWTNLGISLTLTLITISCADIVAGFFKEAALGAILRWLSLGIVINALSRVQEAVINRKLAFRVLALRSLIAVVISGIVGVTMALSGFGVWSLVGLQLSNSFTQLVCLWWLSGWVPSFRFSLKHCRDLFSFGVNILGIGILTFINRRSDDLLIGYFLGPVALGYYSIAYRLLRIMTDLFTSVTSKVGMPVFSKLQENPEKLRNAFYRSTKIISVVSLPAFVAIALFASELTVVAFGEQWLASVQTMRILSFIGIVHSLSFFISTVIIALGKPSWNLAVSSISTVVNVVAFSIVVKWGIAAVATAYVIQGYFFFPTYVLMLGKLTGVRIKKYFYQLSTPVFGACMATIVSFSLSILMNLANIRLENELINLLLSCTLFSVVYLLSIFAVDRKVLSEFGDLLKASQVSRKTRNTTT